MKKLITFLAMLALGAALLAGCTAAPQAGAAPADQAAPPSAGGVLCLQVDPQIALHYDEKGLVTKLEGRNPEGKQILAELPDCSGKDTLQVLEELVEVIGKAGYFIDETEGGVRQIALELDPGSQVPNETFLQDLAAHVKACVERKAWTAEQQTAPAQSPAAQEPVSEGLCPVCADDDCDDSSHCNDQDSKAENPLACENSTACPVCGKYDCGDGIHCGDWDHRHHASGHHSKHHG